MTMPDSQQSPHESLLDDLIDEIASRLNAGRNVDIDEFVARHPDIEQPLRDAHRALMGVHLFRNDSEAFSELPFAQAQAPDDLGDFRLIREIGRGGMGIVYEAEQKSLDRRVALKILPFASLFDERQLRRFKNEARAAAMLKHAHIVSVFSLGFERGVHFFTMELIDGQSLADVIYHSHPDCPTVQSSGRKSVTTESYGGYGLTNIAVDSAETAPVAALSTEYSGNATSRFRNVAHLGLQAADALHFAHQEGVVHRDVKPSNLLLNRDGKLHVTDFGLARIHSGDDLTRTGDAVGTARYMSPEQLEGSDVVDHRTDVYSLGLVLYELLTGRPAFGARERPKLIRQILEQDAMLPRHIDHRIPRDLERIVIKSIAKKPDERYRTARELADDLQRFMDEKPVQARPISSTRRLLKWCRRNRAVALSTGLVSLMLVGLAVGGPLVAWNQARLAEYRRHELYDSDMKRAYEQIQVGDIDQAADTLARYLPERFRGTDYRNFEWYHMVRQCRRRLEATEFRFDVPIWSLAFSRRRDLAIGTRFGQVRVVDPHTNALSGPRAMGAKHLWALAYTHDGRFLVGTELTENVRVWDATTLELLHTEALPGPGWSLAISCEGLIAIGLGKNVKTRFPNEDPTKVLLKQLRIDETGGQTSVSLDEVATIRGLTGDVHGVDFTADGRLLAAGCDDDLVRVWDTTTLESAASFRQPGSLVMHVAFSPDKKFLCTAGGDFSDGEWICGKATVWDMESTQQRFVAHHPEPIYAAAFVGDDRLVTGGVDRLLRVWNVGDGRLVDEINAHAGVIRRIAVMPGTQMVASASEDNTVRVWHLSDVPASSSIQNDEFIDVVDVSFTSQGRHLVSASTDGAIRLWNPERGSFAHSLGEHRYDTYGAAFSPDGSEVVSISFKWPENERGGELKLWEVSTGRLLASETFPDIRMCRSVAFAPSGEHVVFTTDKQLILWNVERWEEERQVEFGIRETGFFVGVSADGETIACSTIGKGGRVRLWQYPTLDKIIETESNGANWCTAVAPDSSSFATADRSSYELAIRSIPDGDVISTLKGHSGVALSLDYSPDGKRLVSACQGGTLILWNLETGREIMRIRDHDFMVWRARFSPDGRTLATGQAGRLSKPGISLYRTASETDARALLTNRHP